MIFNIKIYSNIINYFLIFEIYFFLLDDQFLILENDFLILENTDFCPRWLAISFVSFRFHLFRFVFDLFRFVSICFVSFRFVSVSFRTLQGPCCDDPDGNKVHGKIDVCKTLMSPFPYI